MLWQWTGFFAKVVPIVRRKIQERLCSLDSYSPLVALIDLMSITWSYVQEQWSGTGLQSQGLIRMGHRRNTRSATRVTGANRNGLSKSAYIRLPLLLVSNLSMFWFNLKIRHSQNHPFLSNWCLLLDHDVLGVQLWPLIGKTTPSKICVSLIPLTQVNQNFHYLVGIPPSSIIWKYAIKNQERKKRVLHNWLLNPYTSYLFFKLKKVIRHSSCKFSSEWFNVKLQDRSLDSLAVNSSQYSDVFQLVFPKRLLTRKLTPGW